MDGTDNPAIHRNPLSEDAETCSLYPMTAVHVNSMRIMSPLRFCAHDILDGISDP